jgi:hypothetical protein
MRFKGRNSSNARAQGQTNKLVEKTICLPRAELTERKVATMTVFENIRGYIQEKELLMSLLLTILFLFLSFISHTRLATITIMDKLAQPHTIHTSNYGFPFEMIAIFTPFNMDESYWVEQAGGGTLRIIWGGLIPNFFLYFFLSFAVVYIYRRLTTRPTK